MENVDGRSASTRAKAIGTAVSVSGALLAVLYKGPEIISPGSAVAPALSFPHPLQTSTTNWALGGCLLTVENLLNSSAFILMVNKAPAHDFILVYITRQSDLTRHSFFHRDIS